MLFKRLLCSFTLIGTINGFFIAPISKADIATDYRDNVEVQVAIAQAISNRYGRGLVLPGSIIDMVVLLVKADPARAADIVIAAIKAHPNDMFPILRAVFRVVPNQVEHIITAVLKTFPEANTLPFIVALICELETLKLPVPKILLAKLPPKKDKSTSGNSAATAKEMPASSTQGQNRTNSNIVPPPPPPSPVPARR